MVIYPHTYIWDMKFSEEGRKRHQEARAKQVGENHPRWKGKIKRGGYWYLYLPDHPNGGKQGYVAEHRIVMENHLGRFLLKTEVVHHKDEDKLNNDINNLELFSSPGQHTLKGHPEHIEKLMTINIGIRRSPATEFKKGHKSWNSGLILSDTTKVCKWDGCNRSAWYKNGGKRGYCSKHIQTIRRMESNS